MKVFNLVARQSGTATMWDGQTVDLWGFKEGLGGNVLLPSPLLEVNEGDSVTIHVTNQSSMPHTIHMHGLDVNQANDGVGATSFDIAPVMGTGSYKFKATHAGTYIYHCHVETVVHLQLGMYGAFVVKAANGDKHAWTGGPAFDKDYTWMMSDVDKSWHDNIPMGTTIPTFEPDYFLVNGKAAQQLNDTTVSITANTGDQVYLRLINIGYTITKLAFPPELQAEIISSDGRPLPSSETANEISIYPGERYGVMLDFSTPPIAPNDSITVTYHDMYDDAALYTNRVPLGAIPPAPDPSITYHQLDDFEDETTQAWGSGGPNPNPPTNISSGGPTGLNDSYIQFSSTAAPGAGGKLVMFNTAQWTGDYIAEGVKSIPMDVNNISGPALELRLKFDGPGGSFISQNSIHIAAGSGWQSIVFPIEAADLTGGADYQATMSDVNNLWIFHATSAIFPGNPTASTLGVDNILADGEVAAFPVEWLSFTARPEEGKVALEWTTAQEVSNMGFEVEMAKDDILHNWNKLGFVESQGDSDVPQHYKYLTDPLKSGTYLFRIKQIDLDGTFSYSKVISATMNQDLFASIHPNPIQEDFANLELNLSESGPVTIQITGLRGKLFKTIEPSYLTRGLHELQVDLSDIRDGFYICRIKTRRNSMGCKIMILRD